ncbi:MAG TPA: septal ring lytic transglycosylase RlpA family protein [Caulobacteraceae bacterium]|nr:septal ring lytic transglycosylase RlpA family protein [Caulobacteraceae bacterium]
MGASTAADLARGAALALAALSLAACASVEPRYAAGGQGYGGGYPGGGTAAKPPSKYAGPRVGKPYQIDGRWYYPADQPNYDEVGTASWYGEKFHNHYTADGEVFDMNIPTAAHKTLPLPCLVEVTNLANGRKMVVRVNDRGPFVGDRLIDMSRQAAIELGFYGRGVTQVRVRYVGPATDTPGNAVLYQAADRGPPPPIRPTPVAAAGPQKPQKDRPVPVASSASLLGSQIDPGPLQPAPSNMTWNTASLKRPGPPVEPSSVQGGEIAPTAPPPAPSSDIDSLLDELAATPPSAPTAPAAAALGRTSAVQAGAFASRANAERAAAALPGRAQIVPVEQAGHTLYKVMVVQ